MPGTPYSFAVVFNSSNQPRAALISTNNVLLDSFDYTNGVFYPGDSSLIRKANSKIKEILPR
jgi:hypothetical protein